MKKTSKNIKWLPTSPPTWFIILYIEWNLISQLHGFWRNSLPTGPNFSLQMIIDLIMNMDLGITNSVFPYSNLVAFSSVTPYPGYSITLIFYYWLKCPLLLIFTTNFIFGSFLLYVIGVMRSLSSFSSMKKLHQWNVTDDNKIY